MEKSWQCPVFLLVTVLSALCSVAEIISKSACIGESIQLFQNITLASSKRRVTLLKSGAGREDPIAILFNSNYSIILDKYKSKVFLENGTIMIRNFQLSDEATYAIRYDGQSEREEEQIRAIAPPDIPCKLKLQQVDNYLIARIDKPDYCGRPIVSVFWMENSGIADKNQTVLLELKSVKEPCTYYACIEGEALTCAQRSTPRDYCENFTVRATKEDNIPKPASDTPQSTTNIWQIAAIVFIVLFIVLTILLIYMWKRIILAE